MARNMIAALVVRGGKVERVELEEGNTYPGIRALIGNTITSCFEAPSDDPRRPIWGYCDDEFLLTDNPDWNVVLAKGELYGEAHPIGGPIVITGGDRTTGESRGLTEAEIERFAIDSTMGGLVRTPEGGFRIIPTLRYRAPRVQKTRTSRSL